MDSNYLFEGFIDEVKPALERWSGGSGGSSYTGWVEYMPLVTVYMSGSDGYYTGSYTSETELVPHKPIDGERYKVYQSSSAYEGEYVGEFMDVPFVISFSNDLKRVSVYSTTRGTKTFSILKYMP